MVIIEWKKRRERERHKEGIAPGFISFFVVAARHHTERMMVVGKSVCAVPFSPFFHSFFFLCLEGSIRVCFHSANRALIALLQKKK